MINTYSNGFDASTNTKNIFRGGNLNNTNMYSMHGNNLFKKNMFI